MQCDEGEPSTVAGGVCGECACVVVMVVQRGAKINVATLDINVATFQRMVKIDVATFQRVLNSTSRRL